MIPVLNRLKFLPFLIKKAIYGMRHLTRQACKVFSVNALRDWQREISIVA